MKRNSLRADRHNSITCISCQSLNKRSDPFCHKCGAPVGITATLDPLQTIRAEGFLLRKSLEGRPKLITLLGVWVLHLPVLVVGIGVAIYIIRNVRGFFGFLLFWVMFGLSAYALVVLYRITKNYVTNPQEE